MTNLPVPTPASVVPGNFLTAALWNANVYNGLTFTLNRPMFVGYQATAQAFANFTLTKLSIDTTSVDTYGGHSNTTNNSRYTAQVAGWYLVIGVVEYAANAAGARLVEFYKNNAVITPWSSVEDARGTDMNHSVTCIGFVQMAVGDYVEIVGAQSAGGSLNTVANQSGMAVIWIHA